MATCRYGDGAIYGTPDLYYGEAVITGRTLTWGVMVDWDGDGVFTGENEFAYLQDDNTIKGRLQRVRIRLGREFVFNSSGNGFIHVAHGNLELEFLNQDSRYDPYYAGGELVNDLYENQKIQVVLKDEATDTAYYAFTGYIRDIRPTYGEVKRATIYADGAAVKLDVEIKSSEVYTAVQFDEQVAEALDLAGWDGGTNIDTTVSDSMAYHWFRGNLANTELQDLADAAFGLFFVNEEGTAVYRSRINLDESTQTLTEDDIDYHYGIQIPAPRDVLKNRVRVYARARTEQSDVEIWRMVDRPQISGTGSPIWANFNYNGQSVPAISVTSPVATTDYTAHQNIDGTGTNYTANFSFALTNFATAAELIPTNSGADAYQTLLKLRGTVITADNYTYKEVEDSDSIETYGAKELVISTDWLQDSNSAQEYAETLVGKFATPKVFPRFKFKRSAIGKQFTTSLMNLLTVNFSSRNITGEFRVGYIDREWSISAPNVIDTVVYCEPNLTVESSDEWVFPMSFPTIFP